MRHSRQIKPISYLKANVVQLVAQLERDRQPVFIAQDGEAKAVLQDVTSAEQTQETLALLKILALGNEQVANEQVKPFAEVIKRLKSQQQSMV